MNSDLLFVVGSILAMGIAWVAVAAIRFALSINQTSRNVEQARWEAIAMLRAQLESRRHEETG